MHFFFIHDKHIPRILQASLGKISDSNIKYYVKHGTALHIQFVGASVAKWLVHLPFTSKVAGSSLSENFLNATQTQPCEKGNNLPKVVGFLQVLWFPSTGKVYRVG
jgi:hypothetical protein